MRHGPSTIRQEDVYAIFLAAIGPEATKALCRRLGGRRWQLPADWKVVPRGVRRAVFRMKRRGLSRDQIKQHLELSDAQMDAVLGRMKGKTP